MFQHYSDLLGLPQSPLSEVWTYFARGSPTFPSRDAIKAVDSPQTKAPPPRLTFTWKLNPLPRSYHPTGRIPLLAGEAIPGVFNSQWIFVSDIDITFLRADSKSTDNHPFQNGVRITLHETSIHESAGITFITIADNIFQIACACAWTPISDRSENHRRRAPVNRKLLSPQ